MSEMAYGSPIYQAICLTLAGHPEQAAWDTFSEQDWRDLLRISTLEKVAPLLYDIFKGKGWPHHFPEQTRAELRHEYYNATGNATLHFHELETIVSHLAAANIPVVLLKGAALALTLYPNLALRPLGDLDVLIHQADVERAIQVVRSLGYTTENPPLRRGTEALFFPEVNFRKDTTPPVHLELHWNLLGGAGSRYAADMSWFWQQTLPTSQSHSGALVLSPGAHLLHAAVHLTLKHGGDPIRLLWLFDLHLLITQGTPLDWRQVLQQAQTYHWTPALVQALRQSQALFGTPLPDALPTAGQTDHETLSLLEQIAGPGRTRSSGALTHLAFLHDSAKGKWLAAVLAPDPEYMRWRYQPKPTWLWPLYYSVRWLDILEDIARTVTRRLSSTNNERPSNALRR